MDNNWDSMRFPIEIPNFGRDQLAGLFAELKYTKGAEIGVEQGEYSEGLLSANKDLYLYCIDAWKAYKGYNDHTRQEKLDKFYQITKDRLSNFRSRHSIIRMMSDWAIKEFRDEELDFVYIDANHDFLHVTNDIYNWSKKVRKGGIIAGHDYITDQNEAPHVHVRQVLEGYTQAYNIKPWFVLGRSIAAPDEIRDPYRSWFFIKQ